jgi:hypothetical protein
MHAKEERGELLYDVDPTEPFELQPGLPHPADFRTECSPFSSITRGGDIPTLHPWRSLLLIGFIFPIRSSDTSSKLILLPQSDIHSFQMAKQKIFWERYVCQEVNYDIFVMTASRNRHFRVSLNWRRLEKDVSGLSSAQL